MSVPTPASCPHCKPVLPTSTCTLHYDSYLHNWRPAGFTFDEHLVWVEAVTHATAAATYRAAGLSPEQATSWCATGLPADTAVTWHQAGLNASETTAWLRVRAVTTVEDYRRLAADGHTPASAEASYGTKAGFRWPFRRHENPISAGAA